MRITRGLCCFLACLWIATGARANSIPSYYDQLRFNLTSPSARAGAAGGFANPAVYGVLPGFESQFSWSDRDNRFDSLGDWGLFLGGKSLGFGMVRAEDELPGGGEIAVNDYRISFAGGDRTLSAGIAYGWSGGDNELAGRSELFQAGLVSRVNRYLSLGASGTFAIEVSNQLGLFDLAVRPLGDERLTLWADAEWAKGVDLADVPWSVGAVVEPIAGLQVSGRLFDSDDYALAVAFNLGGLRVAASPRFDKDNNTTSTTYEIRSGFAEPSLLKNTIERDSRYVTMELKGSLKYRRFRFFDSTRNTLLNMLRDLDDAIDDPTVSGVAVNLSGSYITPGRAWEIRQKLLQVKASGKGVVVFAESVGMTQLHLASVADRFVLDPQGIVIAPGYVLGRTYIKGLMEKLGLGFDEWRFLTYKSAAEVLSRDRMSDADREQRQVLLDDLYARVTREVAVGRGVSGDRVDEWINKQVVATPAQALEAGIVDVLGRWEDAGDVVAELEGSRKRLIDAGTITRRRAKSRAWSEPPAIAVVYALGACEMNSGIRARQLEKIMHALRGSRRVKAVVVRVDSPGGKGIAADLVAAAMKKCSEVKPVIVSQGDVAASGGYWLSMNGDRIFTLPGTIVGSIGIIGGWVWDNGIGDKIGHASDYVKAGEEADYATGIRILMSGPRIASKNLSPHQRDLVIGTMRTLYDEFVGLVAEARDMSVEDVEEVAQGRVFSGDRAMTTGLVDEVGGLDVAIAAAREAAGISATDEVTILEFPELPAFNLGAWRSQIPFFGLAGWFMGKDDAAPEAITDPVANYLRTVIENPGRPLYLLPPGFAIESPALRD